MAELTKEYLLKLCNYKLITMVADIDDMAKWVEGKTLEDALTHLKDLKLFTQVISNEEIIKFLGEEVNEDPEEEDESPVVDEGDDEVTSEPEEELEEE